jgi:hypothetical protein
MQTAYWPVHFLRLCECKPSLELLKAPLQDEEPKITVKQIKFGCTWRGIEFLPSDFGLSLVFPSFTLEVEYSI